MHFHNHTFFAAPTNNIHCLILAKNVFRAGFNYFIFIIDAIFEANLAKKIVFIGPVLLFYCNVSLPKLRSSFCSFKKVLPIRKCKKITFGASLINIDCGYVLLYIPNAPGAKIAAPLTWLSYREFIWDIALVTYSRCTFVHLNIFYFIAYKAIHFATSYFM